MTIVINTRSFFQNENNGKTGFINECFKRIVAWQPEKKFVFITDSSTPIEAVTGQNVHSIIIKKHRGGFFRNIFWYNYILPSILKKNKASLLINTDHVCSLRTRVPQCLLIEKLTIVDHPGSQQKKINAYLKKNRADFIKTANRVICLSKVLSNELVDQYELEVNKADVLHAGVNESSQPIDWKEKELIKERYAAGKEYFLFRGSMQPGNNLVNLLKAFSLFKKWQKSNMQLLIAVNNFGTNDPFIESLKNYKYRDDVKLFIAATENECIKITAAAYALVYPFVLNGFCTTLTEAMQCHVPVIAGSGNTIAELYSDAVLYIDPEQVEDIAEKMMQLFKDENSRNKLIEKGKIQAAKFSWDKTAALLWESILQTANQ